MRSLALVLALSVVGCAPQEPAQAPAAKPDRTAIEIADDLEARIDRGSVSTREREEAVAAVRDLVPNTAEDALARAIVIGRLVQSAGLAKAHLVPDIERWALRSRSLDPKLRDEAAARLLGTLWVMAPGQLVKEGDTEKGLALLEELAKRRPDVPQNHLRLAEALVALGEQEEARVPYCRARDAEAKLRPDDRALLASLSKEVPGACPSVSADPASPGTPTTAPPAAQ